MNTDTPRTDAEVERRRLLRYHGTPEKEPKVGADFARQLERELGEARDELRNTRKRLLADDSDSIVGACNCFTMPPGISHHKRGCKYRLVVQRDELRAVAEGLAVCFSDIIGKDWFNDPEFENREVVIGVNSHETKKALLAYEAWKGGEKSESI